MILKTETYNFHRLDLTRQAGFVVTVYDEDGGWPRRRRARRPSRPSRKRDGLSITRSKVRENSPSSDCSMSALVR